ncbi:hypothetical protein COCNU_10G008290 [Cocos nucifera]|uniref:Uncharacterized protein n=1 Tax=Cocos nucifera TaxID=13894 RepID=A0A8K0IM83_COCNU|nr:hypothetical protein COCNU_10G008290 [Cocos nucifera]
MGPESSGLEREQTAPNGIGLWRPSSVESKLSWEESPTEGKAGEFGWPKGRPSVEFDRGTIAEEFDR